MWVCTDWAIDWTAVAAVTAITIWLVDMWRRRQQRRATERFLSQMIIAEFAAAQVEIARLRTTVVVPGSTDMSLIAELRSSRMARIKIANMADKIRLDLPSAILDNATVFRERASNKMAWALVNVRRLHQTGVLLTEVDGSTSNETEIDAVIRLFLEQIRESEEAITAAYSVLLKTGKATWA